MGSCLRLELVCDLARRVLAGEGAALTSGFLRLLSTHCCHSDSPKWVVYGLGSHRSETDTELAFAALLVQRQKTLQYDFIRPLRIVVIPAVGYGDSFI